MRRVRPACCARAASGHAAAALPTSVMNVRLLIRSSDGGISRVIPLKELLHRAWLAVLIPSPSMLVGVESALETHWMDVWLRTLSPPPNFHRFQEASRLVHGPTHHSYGPCRQWPEPFHGRDSN